MTNEIYVQDRTPLQHAYYDFRSESTPEVEFFPFVRGEHLDYLRRYVLMNEVHRRLHPFQFLKAGDKVVHVGFDRVYLERGMSHPLIISALVGETGHVVAIDPDSRNTDALQTYIRANHITNITVINGAAWKCSTTLEFVFDENWSPLSVATEVADKAENGNEVSAQHAKHVAQADTLDTLIADRFPDRVINWISLTANGAEPEILSGAETIMASSENLKIAVALSFHHFSYAIRRDVCRRLTATGYTIAVADSPHDPWLKHPFFFACALKTTDAQLIAMGFHRSDWATLEKEAESKETRLTATINNPSDSMRERLSSRCRTAISRVLHKKSR